MKALTAILGLLLLSACSTAKYEDGATLGKWVRIGKEVSVGAGAKIGPGSVIGDGVTVEKSQVLPPSSRVTAPK